MSISSCIKLPSFKSDISPEKDISSRGQLENDKQTYNELITIANEIFGHGKWSHAVTSQVVDFVEYVMGKYLIGCAAFVRVQLPDGTFHEEMGYSNAESSIKGNAVFEARASSITNALRKALLCFGGIIETKINERMMSTAQKIKVRKNSDNKLSQSDQRIKTETPKVSTSNLGPKLSSSTEISESAADTSKGRTIKEESKDMKELKKDEAKVSSNIPTSTCTVNLIRAPSKSTDSTSRITAMTEEELRLERLRKQKEKKEEYLRRQMMLNGEEVKTDDKVQKS